MIMFCFNLAHTLVTMHYIYDYARQLLQQSDTVFEVKGFSSGSGFIIDCLLSGFMFGIRIRIQNTGHITGTLCVQTPSKRQTVNIYRILVFHRRLNMSLLCYKVASCTVKNCCMSSPDSISILLETNFC